MRYVDVEGARVSVIGLGTWQFGSFEWGYGSDYASKEAPAIVKRAIELGINLIDTAEIYGFGKSESIVGRAIRDIRHQAFVASKVFPVLPVSPIVKQRARASARRLGIEQIDLYQVHWPNPVVPIGTTMDGMRSLQDDGVVRHVGVSNFSLERWQAAEKALARPVVSNQVPYSLVDRRAEGNLIQHAQSSGRIVIAYSPLAQGFLSARYDASNRPSGTMRRRRPLFSVQSLNRAKPLFDLLREVGDAHGATPSQVALAWSVHPSNVVAIPGASSVAQVESNAVAGDLILSEDEYQLLTGEARRFRPNAP